MSRRCKKKKKAEEENEEKETKGPAEKESKRDDARQEKITGSGKEVVANAEATPCETIEERVLSLVRGLGGVEPRVVAEKLGVPLWKVSRAARKLKDERTIKVALNAPDLKSAKRANATFYLDGGKPTALHDAAMNVIWQRNIELGGRSRDFSFEYNGKTWHTDGLLENTGSSHILEIVAGGYDARVVGQLWAYSPQIGHIRIRGIIVVVLNYDCLEKIRDAIKSNGIVVPESGLMVITALRSIDEKKQLEGLLVGGKPMAYHHNPTNS